MTPIRLQITEADRTVAAITISGEGAEVLRDWLTGGASGSFSVPGRVETPHRPAVTPIAAPWRPLGFTLRLPRVWVRLGIEWLWADSGARLRGIYAALLNPNHGSFVIWRGQIWRAA